MWLFTCDCNLQPNPSSSGWWRLITQLSTHTYLIWRSAKGNTNKVFSRSCNQMSWQQDPPITSKHRFYFLDLKTGFSYKRITSLDRIPNFGWLLTSLMSPSNSFHFWFVWAASFEFLAMAWVMLESVSSGFGKIPQYCFLLSSKYCVFLYIFLVLSSHNKFKINFFTVLH